jgi:hypothetical protein
MVWEYTTPVVWARMVMYVKSQARVGMLYVRGCTTLSVAVMIFVMENWENVTEPR